MIKLFGVLDLDSAFYNSFNEIDKKYLEELMKFPFRKNSIIFKI